MPNADPSSTDAALRDALLHERSSAARGVEALRRDLDAVVAASESSNADDEHDPEGATIGFERAQLSALLEKARERLGDLDRALERLDAGAYGDCETCGRRIAPERLAALPASRACVTCASRTRR